MQNHRTHNFVEGKVVTYLLSNGSFGARMLDDENGQFGCGHTRMAAIADLNKAIEAVGSIYERDDAPLAQAAE